MKLQNIIFLMIVFIVLCLSNIAYCQESADKAGMDPSIPFSQFAQQKGVEVDALAVALGLPASADLSQPMGQILTQYEIDRSAVQTAITELNPLAAEASHKDWKKIRLKFILWVLFFIIAMLLLIRGKFSRVVRISILLAATVIFGVWLGVEPNAPGTVKDALMLYGEKGVIFPPRMIALAGFLLMSILGNKIFCGWACQFGTLQDAFWHIPVKKWRPPFWLSNSIRMMFFATLAGCALFIPLDILEPVDPFRIFRLQAPIAAGVAVLILLIGLWIYRPWCTFFCPFGLISWLGERISLARIRVNHTTCIKCRACERVCPTHSIEGIRGKHKMPQDCFACGECLRVCPVSAIKWGLKPPAPADKKSEEKT